MSIHSLGYRNWNGQRAPAITCWIVIARTGIRCAWQSHWLQRMVLLSWLPAVWYAVGFFIWEQSLERPELMEMLRPFVMAAPAELRSALTNSDDLTAQRHDVWAWLLQSFFRYPQALVIVLVIGLIAPRLISQDLRSRAYLIYFSRPLSRSQYVLGKMATLWFYLAAISALPALLLYVIGVLLSPQLVVLQATWDLPARIVAASIVLCAPTIPLALCFSSLTRESRYAGFAWFAVWVLGWVTYGILTSAETFQNRGELKSNLAWTNLSLYHVLGRVQSWVFGFSTFRDIQASALILATVTIVSMLVLYRRVDSPLRA